MAAQHDAHPVPKAAAVRERVRVLVRAVLLTFMAVSTSAGGAGVATKVDAPILTAAESRTVLENDRVRAHLLVYPAGSMTPEHEHAYPRLAVALSGGRLLVQAADGALRSVALQPGDTVWLRPERHRVSNPGPDEVRLVEIDVLDCPASGP